MHLNRLHLIFQDGGFGSGSNQQQRGFGSGARSRQSQYQQGGFVKQQAQGGFGGQSSNEKKSLWSSSGENKSNNRTSRHVLSPQSGFGNDDNQNSSNIQV